MNPVKAGGKKGDRGPRQFREDGNPVNARGNGWIGALENSGRMLTRSRLEEKRG